MAWWDASVGFKPLASYRANNSAGSGFLLFFVVEVEAGAEAEAGDTGKEEGNPFVDMTKTLNPKSIVPPHPDDVNNEDEGHCH
jgi:hypothetical protein